VPVNCDRCTRNGTCNIVSEAWSKPGLAKFNQLECHTIRSGITWGSQTHTHMRARICLCMHTRAHVWFSLSLSLSLSLSVCLSLKLPPLMSSYELLLQATYFSAGKMISVVLQSIVHRLSFNS